MEFILDKSDTKIEWFEAYDLKTLEKKIEERIEINKGILLDVHSVQHQTTYDPNRNKMLHTAVVHFKAKS